MIRLLPAMAALLLAVAACQPYVAPASVPTPTGEAGPPPAPTDPPTVAASPTNTPTLVPTATAQATLQPTATPSAPPRPAPAVTSPRAVASAVGPPASGAPRTGTGPANGTGPGASAGGSPSASASAVPTATAVPATPAPTATPAPPATATEAPPPPSPQGRCAASSDSGGTGQGGNQNHLASKPAYYMETFSLEASLAAPSSYKATIDQANNVTHETLAVPGYPPTDLYVVDGTYLVSTGGGPFVQSAGAPPQLGAFITVQNAICDWLVQAYQSVSVQGTGPTNGVIAKHITETWAAGRQLAFPGYFGITPEPTTADVWYAPILSNLIVKTTSTIRINTTGGPVSVSYQNDITNVNQRHQISVPSPSKPAS
ncbi:MAG TPA: hypothetical protein VK009_00490 [Chloroflexota bacterium]|nr:hypothetical protein [Chloroflexota bacterium]